MKRKKLSRNQQDTTAPSGQSHYGTKCAERRGLYGKAVTGVNCCANAVPHTQIQKQREAVWRSGHLKRPILSLTELA